MEANQSCPHSCSEGRGKERKKNQIDLQLSSAHAIKSELYFSDSVCVRSRIPNNTTDYLRQSDEKLEKKIFHAL